MQVVKAPSADEDMPCRCKLQPSLARHGGNLQDALRRNLRFPARRALVALAIVPDQMLQKYSGGRVLSRTQEPGWDAKSRPCRRRCGRKLEPSCRRRCARLQRLQCICSVAVRGDGGHVTFDVKGLSLSRRTRRQCQQFGSSRRFHAATA